MSIGFYRYLQDLSTSTSGPISQGASASAGGSGSSGLQLKRPAEGVETDETPAFWFQPCEVWEIRGAAPGMDGMGWDGISTDVCKRWVDLGWFGWDDSKNFLILVDYRNWHVPKWWMVAFNIFQCCFLGAWFLRGRHCMFCNRSTFACMLIGMMIQSTHRVKAQF